MREIATGPLTLIGPKRPRNTRPHGGATPAPNTASRRLSGETGMPIALLLPLVLIVLVMASVVPVVMLGYLGASDNTERLMRDRSELILDTIIDQISGHLDPVHSLLDYIADAVASGALDPHDEPAFRSFIAGALAGTPQVGSIVFTGRDETMLRIDREGHESLGDQPVFAAAHTSGGDSSTQPASRWPGSFWSSARRDTVLVFRGTLTGPASNELGTLAAVVSVTKLSRYMAQATTDFDHTPFILVGRERVLAHPKLVDEGTEPPSRIGEQIPDVDTFEDDVLARIWTQEANPLSERRPFRRSEGHWSWSDDKGFESNAYVYRNIEGYGVEPWTVGFHYPGTETRRERWIVSAIGLGGLALLLLSVTAAILVARGLGQPMLSLAEAAGRIEALDFAGARSLPRGPVREVNQAAGAVERMAAGLVWFETYLPKTLVRRLMAAGPGSQRSETRQVTVMFTDLEDYTGFSQTRPADEVVDFINDLIAKIGPIIEESGGTIDKYIGDSVMAFWGAPEDQPDHANVACLAAQRIAREVEAFNAARRAGGLHSCRMRIGLHTGPVAVGNVGFAGRMDYTIVGRTVNVAQAFEQSGRQVIGESEVIILVSDATAGLAGEGLNFEPCSDVRVGGTLQAFRLEHRCTARQPH